MESGHVNGNGTTTHPLRGSTEWRPEFGLDLEHENAREILARAEVFEDSVCAPDGKNPCRVTLLFSYGIVCEILVIDLNDSARTIEHSEFPFI
jgi:hypothetical protein